VQVPQTGRGPRQAVPGIGPRPPAGPGRGVQAGPPAENEAGGSGVQVVCSGGGRQVSSPRVPESQPFSSVMQVSAGT